MLVANRQPSNPEPAIRPIGATANSSFGLEINFRRHRFHPCLQDAHFIIGMYRLAPALAQTCLRGQAGVVQHPLVCEGNLSLGIGHQYQLRVQFCECTIALLAGLQGPFRTLALGDFLKINADPVFSRVDMHLEPGVVGFAVVFKMGWDARFHHLAILPFKFRAGKLRPDCPDILADEVFCPLTAALDSLLVGKGKGPVAVERGVACGYVRQQFRQLSFRALGALQQRFCSLVL